MKILQIAPLEETVPPMKYGGTELVVYNLTEELVKRNHDVYLFASGDSKTSAHLVAPIEKSVRKTFTSADLESGRELWLINGLAKMRTIIRELQPDIIHNHNGWPIVTFADDIYKNFNIPMITTLHGPLNSMQEDFIYHDSKSASFISISNNQRKALPNINYIETVYNGIDVAKFDLSTEKREYFAILGRISKEKGIKEICELIKKTNEKLVIAAKLDPTDQEYFEKDVKPLIDNDQIKFIGEVDHQGKNEFLGKAKALLVWLNWEEPFGLVTIEANACGTPIIANRRGSMPEIVQDGVNGYLVDTLDEMEQKLSEVSKLSPLECRKVVEKRFSVKTMVDGYENAYKKIASKK